MKQIINYLDFVEKDNCICSALNSSLLFLINCSLRAVIIKSLNFSRDTIRPRSRGRTARSRANKSEMNGQRARWRKKPKMNEQRDPSRLPGRVRKTLKTNRLITRRLISCDRPIATRMRLSIVVSAHQNEGYCIIRFPS